MSEKAAHPSSSLPRFLTGGTRLALVFALAVLVRVAYLLQMRDNLSFHILALDSDLFDRQAMEILGGKFWGEGVYYSPPFYPYFLAAVYSVFGHSLEAVRYVQVFLSGLTAVLVVRLSEVLFDEPVPLLAGLVAALYAPFIFFSGVVLGTTLDVLLVTLGVLLFCLAEREGAPRRRDAGMLLAGLAAGYASLLRPNTAAVVPLWVAGLWLVRRGTRWVRPAAWLVLGAALAIGPVTVRNALLGRDFVPISSHGGINFWIGNHPGAIGTFDLPPGIRGTPEEVNRIDSTRLATEAAGRPLKPSEVSAFWFRKGLGFIRENPGEFAGLVLHKVRMFWNRVEIPLNVNFHFFRRSSALLRIPGMEFGLVSPLAFLGLVLMARRWRRFLPAYSLVAVYFASAVGFFVSARYRLPVVPVLIPFACYAGVWFYGRIREKAWKPVVGAGVALVLLGVHAWVPVAGFSIERSFARDYYYLGAEYQRLGSLDEAVRMYHLSLEKNGSFWLAENGLGVSLSKQGKTDEALEAFHRAIALEPTRPEPWTNLGIALALVGRIEEAADAWTRALALNPDDATARSSLERARGILRAHDPTGLRE